MVRAGTLIASAKAAAKEAKVSVALEGYWKSGAGVRITAAAVGGVASTVLSTLAVSGAVAGGVAFGVATLGIGPAVSVVFTVALLKTIGGITYWRTSESVKTALKGTAKRAGATGSATTVDIQLLGATAKKVLKKLDRIGNRLDQVGPSKLGAVKRAAMKIWNPYTAAKTFGTAEAQAPFSPRVTIQDGKLNALLRQLRFYGQVLYNSTDQLLEAFVTEKRDLLGGAYTELCEGVVEWARHSQSEHNRCSPSACMLRNHTIPGSQELKKIVSALEDAGIPVTSTCEPAAGPRMTPGVADSAARQARMRAVQATVEARPGTSAVDVIIAAKGGALYVAPEATAALKSALLPSATAPSVAATVTGAGMYAGAGGGVAAAEITNTIQNRLIRRSVLQDARIRSAMALTTTQGEAQVETIDELKKLLKGKNIISNMPRVVQKCLWYVEKLKEIEEKFVALRESAIRAPPSCDLAYELVYLASYYYRNAEKFIAFLVYLETALLQIDLAVAQSGIGVLPGEIIRPGAEVIPIDVAAEDQSVEAESEEASP